jgi:hypothetical protein
MQVERRHEHIQAPVHRRRVTPGRGILRS